MQIFLCQWFDSKTLYDFWYKNERPSRPRTHFLFQQNRPLVGQIFDWLTNQFDEVSQNTIHIVWIAFNNVYWAQSNHLCWSLQGVLEVQLNVPAPGAFAPSTQQLPVPSHAFLHCVVCTRCKCSNCSPQSHIYCRVSEWKKLPEMYRVVRLKRLKFWSGGRRVWQATELSNQ